MSCFHAIAAVLGMAIASAALCAEPQVPAGELPVGTFAPNDDSNGVGPTVKADKKTSESNLEETWESYSDVNSSSVAQEVTKGVRVEDIIEPPSDYRYAAFGKTDPFLPPAVAESPQGGPAAETVEVPILSPLQLHGLAELSLVGIWQLPSGERKAMVLTPGGQREGGSPVGVVIRDGDPIGNKGGKVLAISNEYVVVREFTLSPDGSRLYTDQQLFMARAPDTERNGRLVFEPGQAPKVVFDHPGVAGPGGPDAGAEGGAPAPVEGDNPQNPQNLQNLPNFQNLPNRNAPDRQNGAMNPTAVPAFNQADNQALLKAAQPLTPPPAAIAPAAAAPLNGLGAAPDQGAANAPLVFGGTGAKN